MTVLCWLPLPSLEKPAQHAWQRAPASRSGFRVSVGPASGCSTWAPARHWIRTSCLLCALPSHALVASTPNNLSACESTGTGQAVGKSEQAPE